MRKLVLCLITALCLFGRQAKLKTDEILRTQAEQFLECVDTLPAMPEDLFDEAKTTEERTELIKTWSNQLHDHLTAVMADEAIEAFAANRMTEDFDQFLGLDKAEMTQEHRQVTNVETLSDGDADVTVTYTAGEKTVKLLLNFKETEDGWRIFSLRVR